MALHTLEICSGVGMLGEGLRAGLQYMGVETRTVCHIEREAYAAAVLAARMEEGSMDPAPVWSDLLTFDAAAWRGAVDCIVAGFPCQDLSLAGKRAGLDGKRSGLFFDILDIADACGARYLFLENVAGIASATASVVDEAEGALDERAAARVMGELADRGWNAEWITLSASDVGASHGRSRWFCWAWRMGHPGLQHQHLQQREDGAEHSGAGQPVAHAERAERGPERAGSIGSIQGHNGHGREADCGAGVAEQVLGDTPGRNGPRHQVGAEPQEPQCSEPGGELAYPENNGCECGAGRGTDRDGLLPPQRGFEGRDSGGASQSIGCSPPMADPAARDAKGANSEEHCTVTGGGRKHMDQLSNFVAHSSHLAQPIPDGQTSSESGPDSLPPSQKRLNPAFGELLMGWPVGHTIAEPRACGASEMVLWRSRLQQHLCNLFDGQE